VDRPSKDFSRAYGWDVAQVQELFFARGDAEVAECAFVSTPRSQRLRVQIDRRWKLTEQTTGDIDRARFALDLGSELFVRGGFRYPNGERGGCGAVQQYQIRFRQDSCRMAFRYDSCQNRIREEFTSEEFYSNATSDSLAASSRNTMDHRLVCFVFLMGGVLLQGSLVPSSFFAKALLLVVIPDVVKLPKLSWPVLPKQKVGAKAVQLSVDERMGNSRWR